jgi:hypothetical protein
MLSGYRGGTTLMVMTSVLADLPLRSSAWRGRSGSPPYDRHWPNDGCAEFLFGRMIRIGDSAIPGFEGGPAGADHCCRSPDLRGARLTT